MNKLILSNDDVNSYVRCIIQQIARSAWRPDIIVGLSRGGLVPAVMLSHYYGAAMWPLKVSLRDDEHVQDSSWMAKLAHEGSHILIVDDINDTGATLQLIKDSWQNVVGNSVVWDVIWKTNVRVAVLVNNLSSQFDYTMHHGIEINKAEDDVWVVFPWEDFR